MNERGSNRQETTNIASNEFSGDLTRGLPPVPSVGGGSGEITSPAVAPESEPAERPVGQPESSEAPADSPRSAVSPMVRIRREIASLPQNTEGLDLDRVAAFTGRLGLRETLTVHLEKALKGTVAQLLNGPDAPYSENLAGAYVSKIDTCIVYRNQTYEALNGPEYIDCLTVHEKAHGSLKSSMGGFLEEGFADHIRGRYVVEELGLPQGLADMPTDMTDYSTNAFGKASPKLLIPSCYFVRTLDHLDHKDSAAASSFPSIAVTSIAGAAIDSLVEKDPALGAALIEARRSEEGLQEVIDRINAIHPGLYVALRYDYNNYADYPYGLQLVRAAVGKDEPKIRVPKPGHF